MKKLTRWLRDRYDIISSSPSARKVAKQFLFDSGMPADPQSIEAVLQKFRSMNLMMGRVQNPGARLRLVRKSCCP